MTSWDILSCVFGDFSIESSLRLPIVDDEAKHVIRLTHVCSLWRNVVGSLMTCKARGVHIQGVNLVSWKKSKVEHVQSLASYIKWGADGARDLHEINFSPSPNSLFNDAVVGAFITPHSSHLEKLSLFWRDKDCYFACDGNRFQNLRRLQYLYLLLPWIPNSVGISLPSFGAASSLEDLTIAMDDPPPSPRELHSHHRVHSNWNIPWSNLKNLTLFDCYLPSSSLLSILSGCQGLRKLYVDRSVPDVDTNVPNSSLEVNLNDLHTLQLERIGNGFVGHLRTPALKKLDLITITATILSETATMLGHSSDCRIKHLKIDIAQITTQEIIDTVGLILTSHLEGIPTLDISCPKSDGLGYIEKFTWPISQDGALSFCEWLKLRMESRQLNRDMPNIYSTLFSTRFDN
ncbi:hypothetical protein H0H87_008923 [Tephrocybe sp. NHM501043]|nr:hypothetical protein H0H87_008923 [Tephrocybe sp. NHM501043]